MTRLSQSRQRKVLNLMIPVLAFLIILFLFLGKKMEQGVPPETRSGQTKSAIDQPMSPTLLDFGQLQIRYYRGQWIVEPAKALSPDMVKRIGESWRLALNGNFEEQVTRPEQSAASISGELVSLSFAQIDEPLIVKVQQQPDGRWQIGFLAQHKVIKVGGKQSLLLLPPEEGSE